MEVQYGYELQSKHYRFLVMSKTDQNQCLERGNRGNHELLLASIKAMILRPSVNLGQYPINTGS